MLQSLKEAAHEYWRKGLNIILLRKKKPLHEWRHWQTQRQSESDFEDLPWNEADGFALIGGSKLENELYFGAIDYDVKNVTEEAKEKGKQVLRHLPTTQLEQTPSGGQHWIYLSRTKPKTISTYHNSCALELIGEGKLCIMAPSKGYTRLNDNQPTIVQDFEQMVFEALEKSGIQIEKTAEKWFNEEAKVSQPYRGKDPPCIKALRRGTKQGLRNEYGIRLASYLLNFRGINPEKTFKSLSIWNRLNEPPLDKRELQSIFKSGLHNQYCYGCNDHILSSLCDKQNCELAKKKQDKPVFDELTKAKARKMLEDPAFFYKLGKVFEQGIHVKKINKPRFVIKEERNKRLLGLLLIGAAKLGMTSIIKVLGAPGTAKDTMLRLWLELLPLKSAERSYLTAATLRYSKELQEADLLYIPDSPELSGEKGRHLRFMRADDGGLISEYALKDPTTGEMTTTTVSLPIKAVATTSNAVTGDTALESGMWTLQTNGSPELTREVKQEKLKFRAGKRQLFPEDELKVWKCAFHLLLTEELPEELPKVPFAESLMKLLESQRTESRRDPDKLCDLISLIAWVRRFQKPPEKRGEADLADFYYALQLGLDAITETISDLNEKEQQIFNAVKNAEETENVSCRYVAGETGIPYKTCYRLLEKLVEKGFLNKDKAGNKNVYSVFPEKEPKQLLISEGRNQQDPKQLLEFILSSIDNFPPSHNPKNTILIDPLTGDKLHVSIEKDGEPLVSTEKNCILYPSEKVRSSERRKETILNLEKKPKELISKQMRNDLSFSFRKQPSKHIFLWRRIPPGEKCELCGKQAVEYEIKDVQDKQILRRCQNCFNRMRHMFTDAEWRNMSEEDFSNLEKEGGGIPLSVSVPI